MSLIRLSLADLFVEAFGYRSEAFEPRVGDVWGVTDGKRTEQGKAAGSPYYAKDALGREYYMPVEIQVGDQLIPGTNTSYAEALGVKNKEGNYTGRWMLPYPVVSVTDAATIIDTPLTERNGWVSEFINIQGFKITIRGFLINKDGNEFPEEDYATLIRLRRLKIPVRINCPVTDVLFVDPEVVNGEVNNEVTVRSVQVMGREGVKGVVPYVIELWTNEPFNLKEI